MTMTGSSGRCSRNARISAGPCSASQLPKMLARTSRPCGPWRRATATSASAAPTTLHPARAAIAARAGWSVEGAADAEVAVALLQGPHGREVRASIFGSWDAEQGPALILALREHRPELPVIVISHGDTVSIAVEAMRAGASDFL